MAVVKREPVVNGQTETGQRTYLKEALAHLRPDFPQVHIAACGQFSLVLTALDAGYPAAQVTASDCSLWSDLIGSLVDPGFPEPEYRLSSDNEARWRLCLADGLEDTPVNRAAFLMWVMKRAEYEGIEHLEEKLEDLEERRTRHVRALAVPVASLVARLQGIHYVHRSLPDIVGEIRPPDEVLLVPAPIYTGREVKGFRYENHIVYDPKVEPFSWAAEFPGMYDASKLSDGPAFWYWDRNPSGFPEGDVVFSKETRPGRQEYWLCSHPELLEGMDRPRRIASFTRNHFSAYPLPIWGLHDELRRDSKIRFVSVTQNIELYYRDLWAHRLGSTAGDRYLLMIVDEKVFAAVILQLGAFTHMESRYIFEQSGFSAPSKRYKRMVRLLMWCVTCRQWGDDVMRLSFKQNRVYDPIGCETTCLSKYRKMKGNLGILKDRFRVRMPNGLYRIIQNAEFREEGYTECIARFLDEQDSTPEGAV